MKNGGGMAGRRGADGRFSRKDGEFFGTYVDDKGYLRISAGKQRGVRVATLVLEAKLGRKLRKDEDCHHLDLDKTNCEYTNLVALGHKEHGAVSNKQRMFLIEKEKREKAEWEAEFGEGSTDYPVEESRAAC